MKQIVFIVLSGLLFACSGNRNPAPTPPSRYSLDSIRRVELDFNRSREDVISWIQEHHRFTPTNRQLNRWEKSRALEYRIIDGEKRYFRNAAANLFRVDSQARSLSQAPPDTAGSGTKKILDKHLTQLIPTETKGKYFLPKVTMQVKYTLKTHSGIGGEEEIYHVWLPYPRQDIRRQTDVKLIRTFPPFYILSEDKTGHTSIYMERIIFRRMVAFFQVEYLFTSQGEWFDLTQIDIQPYQTQTEEYRKYTSERTPHIRFSDKIRAITDSVTRDAVTPVENLQAIYRYITANYPWASALEYSTIPDIPAYVLENGRGDCGQVTLLLITMLRYKGIPARWQSGWMMHPGEVNLHDWAEVYFEGAGWIPVDVSFGRGEPLDNKVGREFFMSGIDSYRLTVNSDFSDSFFPEKQFPRSETVDFQRGEVESESWNLYFNLWNYKMEVTYR